MTKTYTTRNFADSGAITRLERFTTGGAVKGEPRSTYPPESGRLEGKALEVFREGIRTDAIAYVVYSYNTPIAWLDLSAGVWYMPEAKYSPTTSKHQGQVAYALRGMDVAAI